MVDCYAVMFSSTPYQLSETELLVHSWLCRLMQAPLAVRRTLNQPDSYDYTTVKDLERFTMSTFAEEHDWRKCRLYDRGTSFTMQRQILLTIRPESDGLRITVNKSIVAFVHGEGRDSGKVARKWAALHFSSCWLVLLCLGTLMGPINCLCRWPVDSIVKQDVAFQTGLGTATLNSRTSETEVFVMVPKSKRYVS